MSDEVARLRRLRNCFDRATKRLESLPETGLSEAGQPYIQEVADALQSFAAWFQSLTFDHYSMMGSARRVHIVFTGLDAIVDWVGLHRSQEFASDVAKQWAELVEQGEALDAAVMAAFLVERTPSSVTYRRSQSVPEEKRVAVEDGIEAVASLAGHLGIRLQRIALMAGSSPNQKTGTVKQPTKRRRRGGGRPETYPEKLCRDVVAARERDKKQAAKLRRRLPPIPRWLRDYCDEHSISIREQFPPHSEGEAWSVRANRFWKAATKRLREAETNRH